VLEAYKRLNDGLEWLIVGFTGLLVLIVVALPFVSAAVRFLTGEGYTWLAEARRPRSSSLGSCSR